MQCKTTAILQILFILSFLLKVCRGIDCYQCNSKEDVNCDTKIVDLKYLRPCSTSHVYCRKCILVYYFTDSREYITIRECALLKTDSKDCYRGRYSRDSYQRICECKESGCNGSTRSLAGVSRIVIVFMLAIQLFFS